MVTYMNKYMLTKPLLALNISGDLNASVLSDHPQYNFHYAIYYTHRHQSIA